MPSKDELEIRKLELEIDELGRPWWQRPALIAAWASVATIIVAYVLAWQAGYFDRERVQLRKEKALLQRQVEFYDKFVKEATKMLDRALKSDGSTHTEPNGGKTPAEPPKPSSAP